MKKVIFVIPTLGEGGAEKVLSILLNHLNGQHRSLVLVLFNRVGSYLHCIPSNVRIYDLGKKSKFSFPGMVIRLASIIRKERPDTVVSFLEYANLVLMAAKSIVRFKSTRWIICERSLPTRSLIHNKKKRLKIFLHKWLDNKADLVLANSDEAGQSLSETFRVKPEKIKVIPNPVEIELIQRLATEEPGHPWLREDVPVFISVGRLIQAKGYPYLIRAFAPLLQGRLVRLIILGEGEMRSELEGLNRKLGIEDHVLMPGFMKNPYAWISRADVFILSSLWEGLPNALLEAMALGKPAIATMCNTVVNRLITPGKNGIVVPPGDVESLKGAMTDLLNSRDRWPEFALENKKRATQFDVHQIIKLYEEILVK